MSLDYLIELAVRSTVLFGLAWLVTTALRRSSAAVRHQVWAAALLGSLALPALMQLLPEWRAQLVTTVTPLWTEQLVIGGSSTALQWDPVPAEAGPAVSVARFTSPPRRAVPSAEVILTSIWLAGFAVLLLRLAIGLVSLRRFSRRSKPLTLPRIAPQDVALLESARASTMPVTWGTWSPRILLPAGAANWPESQLRIVLAHERAHIHRCDWLVQIVAEFARAVYRFHPFAWLAAARLRDESERACDDAVLCGGQDAQAYADHLVHIAATLTTPVRGRVAALAVARAPRFERRLTAMLNRRVNRRSMSRRSTLVMAMASLAALIPLAALAPGQEIRGVVLEPGTGHPIEGAEVTISKLPTRVSGQPALSTGSTDIGTITTDAQGVFRFEAPEFGEFSVSVRKEGYTSLGGPFRPTTQANVSLSAERPAREVRLTLGRQGEAGGRIVDADTGAPVASLRVSVEAIFYNQGLRMTFPRMADTTDPDGRFHAAGLAPGEYVVAVQSFQAERDRFVDEISSTAIEKVDDGYEPGYFPGGPALENALPVRLGSGESVDFGVVPVRRVRYHRVHVTVSRQNCPPEAKVQIAPYTVNRLGATQSAASTEVECGAEVLMRNFPPGSYMLSARTTDVPQDQQVSANVPLLITDSNLELEVTLSRGFPLEGRIALAAGVRGLTLEEFQVTMLAIGRRGVFLRSAVDANGSFHFENLQPARLELAVGGLPSGAYLNELRYRGTAQPGRRFDFSGDGSLEVEIDTQPGIVNGTVADRDRPVEDADIVLVRWPLYPDDPFQGVTHATSDEDGSFLSTLPPGEYRAFALAPETKDKLNEPGVLERLSARAERVTLSRGGSENLSLDVEDPSR